MTRWGARFDGWPVIGMVHLGPLPGAARVADLASVRTAALADAAALVAGGCAGLMIENFGDAPFLPGAVAAHTVAAMTALAGAVGAAHPHVPLGINVLRNDAAAALGIAAAVGAAFVRVNVHLGARVTDQGLLQGQAHETLRLRRALGAESIAIWADVAVKHSQPLGPEDRVQDARDLVARGMASALIVTGSGTGRPVAAADLTAVRDAVTAPILIGSGLTVETAAALRPHADGAIVGTAFKRGDAVDRERVAALIDALG